ncbi:cox cluster protein [Halomicrobium sp. HM KBTZ05]|uniref:Cox cluster protein n=1 Tax=Halomicrobium mukohataei TaxID=57705 RepID=A0A847UG45_9EURY|nr:cox cluster protein [Halomicrobium mukohataei]
MSGTLRGDRLVVRLYLIIVALTGVMGYVLAWATDETLEPELFGVVALPPTPVGVAVFGMVTIGTGLGVLLALVVYVANNFDDDARNE